MSAAVGEHVEEEPMEVEAIDAPPTPRPPVRLDATVDDAKMSIASDVLSRWKEPFHHEAAQVIQRWTRGKQGRLAAARLRKAANDVKKQNKLALAQKRSRKMKASSVTPADFADTGQSNAVLNSRLVSFRVLKMATIGFKGLSIADARSEVALSPSTSGEACKTSGRWRYELTLEQVVPADVGNVLVGWASAISHDADLWQAGFSNGETPQFTTPTRWWGPVFSRSQLAADAPDEATVVINVAVDLDAPIPICWYNMHVDKSAPDVEGMQLESIYATARNPSGWNAVDMTDLRYDMDGDPTTDARPSVYPVISLSSSVATTINFGQMPFECTGPDEGGFFGLLSLGAPSPVRSRKLLLLGGFVQSIDYREKMPGLIELAAKKGWWDLMRLMLTGRWDQLASCLKDDEVQALDAESIALLSSEDTESRIEPHRMLVMTNGHSKTLIHIAIENKRFTFVDKLFDWLPPNADREVEKLSASADNVLDLETVMAAEVKLLGTQDQDGCTPLLLAIQNGQDKMANRILDKAIAIDKTYRMRTELEGAPARTSVTSRIATQKNENGQAALWAAIETKSDLALRLVDIPDVNNNERNEMGITPLMRAIEIDNVPMIDELLDAGDGRGDDNTVDLKLENSFGFSAVTLASYLPDREAVLEKLLDKAERRAELEHVLAARCKTEAQRTALMYAIDSENTASAKKLLEYYGVVYGRDSERAMELASIKGGNGATALIIAIDEKNAEVVDALVDLLSKDSLKQKYRDKEPIVLAIKNANVPAETTDGALASYLPESCVEKLVAARFQNAIADQNDAGDAELLSELLDDAVNFSLFRVVTALLYQGAKPRKPSTAAAAGDIEFFEKSDALNESTINQIHLAEDDSGSTYLMLACRAGSLEFVSYLLDRYSENIVADVQNRDTGETAIITAARGGHVQVVKKLLQWAARPSKTKRFMMSKPVSLGSMDPLELIEKGEEEVSAGDRINLGVHSKDGTNLLMALCSVRSPDPTAAKELLDVLELLSRMTTEHIKKREEWKYAEEQRAKGNNVKSKGISPIKVKGLKKDFANLQDANGDTALDLAVRNDNIELAMALKLAWGAVVGFRSAAVIGSTSEFRLLVDAATAVSESDPRELFTPLHLACRNTLAGSADKAMMLLDRSADPSLQTRDGWTPLMFACQNVEADGKVATVQALLDSHADTDLQNSDGSTALTLTLKGKAPFSPKQMLVAAMLVGAGADLFISDHSGYCALDDCSEIAGDALEHKGDEDYAEIFATMINRGVHLGSLGASVDAAVRSQRGFILPDFDLDEMRKSGLSVVTNPSEDMRAKTSIVLRAYAAMDAGEIARCATYNYMHDGLFVAMMKGMWLAHLADVEARRVRALDETHASGLSALSDRIQLSAAGLLCVKQDASGERTKTSVQDFLEKFSEGESVLMAASKYQMKAVLSHPEIQRYSERLWWGWMHPDLKAKGAPKVVLYVAVACTLAVQLVLSPIIGLLPFIGRWAQEGDHRALRWLSRFFGVPIIDFISASVCNVTFLVLLMYHSFDGALYQQRPTYTWFLAVWAFSDLWSELVELTDGFEIGAMKKELFAVFNENYRSEYNIDPFNVFDLSSCVCSTVGLVWLNVARDGGYVTMDALAVASGFGDGTVDAVASLASAQAKMPPGAGSPSVTRAADGGLVGVEVFDSVHISVVRWLLTLAVFFGWMRMLRLLSMSEQMGPFILMFLQMFADIGQWLVLLFIILLSTSSGLYVLHALGTPKPYKAETCAAGGTPFTHFEGALFKMFEGSLVGEPYFSCMGLHNPFGSVDYWIAWLVAVGFQIVVGLLLVNMLIAKMAKTFDSIWENQGVNFMFLRARTCMAWDEAPLVCSPFIALSWPALIANKLLTFFSSLSTATDGRFPVMPLDQDEKVSMGETPPMTTRISSVVAAGGSRTASPKLPTVPGHGTPPALELHQKVPSPTGSPRGGGGTRSLKRAGLTRHESGRKAQRQGTTRRMLTSVGARQSQEEATGSDGTQQSWTKQQEAEICDLLMNWILDHEDEVNQSERWRTQMQKKNAKRFDRVDKGINSLVASLKEVKKNQLAAVQTHDRLVELRAMVEELKGAHGVGATAAAK